VRRDVPDSPGLRIATLRLLLTPGSVITGDTAAWLYGVWNPPPGSAVPLQVTRAIDAGCIYRRGVAGARRLLRRWEVTDADGIPAVIPLRAAFEQMRAEHMLAEAVAHADAYIHAGLITREMLAAYLKRFDGYRGIRMARWASILARAGAESPGESRLRVQLMMAGLPEPETQLWVGKFARLDLAYRQRDGTVAFGIEYDGEVHLGPHQARHDVRRDARLGFPCLRFTKWEVHERVSVARVTERLEALGLLGERIYPVLPHYPWP
jgi:hypothetical protein